MASKHNPDDWAVKYGDNSWRDDDDQEKEIFAELRKLREGEIGDHSLLNGKCGGSRPAASPPPSCS